LFGDVRRLGLHALEGVDSAVVAHGVAQHAADLLQQSVLQLAQRGLVLAL